MAQPRAHSFAQPRPSDPALSLRSFGDVRGLLAPCSNFWSDQGGDVAETGDWGAIMTQMIL